MARKKRSETEKTDAPKSAADDLTPSNEARDTPEAENSPLPDDASGIDTVEASEDTAETETPPEAVEDSSRSMTDQPRYDVSEPDTGDAPETPPEDTATPETPPVDATQDMPEAETVESVESDATVSETEGPREADPDQEIETDIPPQEPPTQTTEEPTPMVRTEQVTVRQGGFWSMLIGGIAAAGIGVAAAPYIQPYLPGNDPVAAPDDGLAAQVDEQAERLAEFGARLDGLPQPTDAANEIAGLKDEVGGLGETLTDLTERLANLEAQVSNLAARPAPEGADTAATDAALDDLRDRLIAQRGEIEDLRATLQADEAAARDSARATLQRAALTRLMTALDTGDEFSDALTDLRDTGAAVPDALAEVSETGVPTRAQLVESFPEAARAALAIARSTEGGASVGGFLRAQLGVRSLEPREGDDTDAILSRAEAALAAGRAGDALAEIETLPEDTRAAMSEWEARATARRDALAAAEALSAELN